MEKASLVTMWLDNLLGIAVESIGPNGFTAVLCMTDYLNGYSIPFGSSAVKFSEFTVKNVCSSRCDQMVSIIEGRKTVNTLTAPQRALQQTSLSIHLSTSRNWNETKTDRDFIQWPLFLILWAAFSVLLIS